MSAGSTKHCDGDLRTLPQDAEACAESHAAHKGGSLILCPTPLGNLGDVSERTLEAFRAADTICAEDTRVTSKLLAAYGIEKRLERLDEEAISQKADWIINRVLGGETIAFCSDAGMPGVSDPGLRLVAAARAAGAHVDVLPGPSAVTTAYVASGFTCPRFYFGGFLPRKDAQRTSTLTALKNLDACLLFYESPNRVVESLAAIALVFPYRRVAVCRELTKLHEEVYCDGASAVLAEFQRREAQGRIKGEIVLVVDASSNDEVEADAQAAAKGAEVRAQQLREQGLSKKDIVSALQSEFGLSRNQAYDVALG